MRWNAITGRLLAGYTLPAVSCAEVLYACVGAGGPIAETLVSCYMQLGILCLCLVSFLRLYGGRIWHAF